MLHKMTTVRRCYENDGVMPLREDGGVIPLVADAVV